MRVIRAGRAAAGPDRPRRTLKLLKGSPPPPRNVVARRPHHQRLRAGLVAVRERGGDGLVAAECINSLLDRLHSCYVTRCYMTAQALCEMTARPPDRQNVGMGRRGSPLTVLVGKRMEAARIAADFDTMRDFAAALAIPEARYRRWEKGEAQATYEALVSIAQATGKTVDFFLRTDAERPFRAGSQARSG